MFASVSRSEEGTMLQKRSSELTVVFIPVIIFVSVLMIFGLFGNSMVLYFYGWKTRRTPSICFILVLTVFDLLTCTLGMPMEIVDLVLNITFYNVAACKILRFVTYFTNIASALTLASIAIDRYRRICTPHKNQLSLKLVKIICGLCTSASVLLSWPASIFFVIEPVTVIYTDPNNTTREVNITGCDCTLTKSKWFTPYILTFHVFHFIGFVALTILLAVMYGIIARRLFYYRRKRLDFAASYQSCTRIGESSLEQSDMSSLPTAASTIEADSQRARDGSNLGDIVQPGNGLEELDKTIMGNKMDTNHGIKLYNQKERNSSMQSPSSSKCTSVVLRNTDALILLRTRRNSSSNTSKTNSIEFETSTNRRASWPCQAQFTKQQDKERSSQWKNDRPISATADSRTIVPSMYSSENQPSKISLSEGCTTQLLMSKTSINSQPISGPVYAVRNSEQCNPPCKGASSLHDLSGLEANPRENNMILEINRETPGSQSIRFRTGPKDNNSVVKHTVMMFIVALVFVLSFLPYLSVAIKGLFQDGYEVNIFTNGQLVGLELGYRSHFINGAFNPLIYGFFNSQFRYFVYRKLCPCRFWTG